MTRQVIYGADALVAEWVRLRCPGVDHWGDCAAIGLAEEGRLLAGIVYSRYFPGISIDMSVAAEPGSRWLSRGFLSHLFAYPFAQLGVGKVQALVAAGNHRSSRLVSGLGFQLEGRLREGWHRGEDLLAYGLLRRECRWIKDNL